MLRILERIIGYPPKEVKEMLKELYDDKGFLQHLEYPAESINLLSVIRDKYRITDAEMIAEVILTCMRYKAADRPTPDQLLTLSWFR
jgi:hypothetical protein